MKKLMALLLALTLILALLVGCGGGSGDTDDANTPGGEEPGGEEPSGEAPLSVAMVIAGSLGDKGFNDNSKAGLDKAVEDFGIEIQVIELATNDKTKYEPTLLDLADSGEYDLITASGNAMREVLESVAEACPDQKFYLYDASVDYNNGDFPNVYCNTFLQNEASFLAGIVAAGMTSQTNLEDLNSDKVVGNVLMMDMAVINDFMVGFIEGIQYADPEVKVNSAYIGAVDAAKAKDMALAMYQQNCDIVFQVAASAGLGVIEAAKESNGYVIGVDQDQAAALMDSDPDAANRILTSVLKRTDTAVYRIIEMMINDPDNVPWGTSEALGMQEDCVGLAKNDLYEEMVSQEVRDMVADAEAKIASGEIEVGTAYGMTAEEITALRDSVRP